MYIASNPDLIVAFGGEDDPEKAATMHYIEHGFVEGRATDEFDAEQYLDNYEDLQAAFGEDDEAATAHYIRFGFAEGRTDAPRDGEGPEEPEEPEDEGGAEEVAAAAAPADFLF